MNCTGCGAIVPAGATACPACGRPSVMSPPPSSTARVTTPIRKVAATTVQATKVVVSDVKKTGKAALGEAKIAVRDVGTLTRQAVHEVGKELESLGKDLQKAKKEK
jgi:hypothetical protein